MNLASIRSPYLGSGSIGSARGTLRDVAAWVCFDPSSVLRPLGAVLRPALATVADAGRSPACRGRRDNARRADPSPARRESAPPSAPGGCVPRRRYSWSPRNRWSTAPGPPCAAPNWVSWASWYTRAYRHPAAGARRLQRRDVALGLRLVARGLLHQLVRCRHPSHTHINKSGPLPVTAMQPGHAVFARTSPGACWLFRPSRPTLNRERF